MKQKALEFANHPGSLWAGIAFVVATAISAWQGGNTAMTYAVETESSHFEALMDLRDKVTALHSTVMEHDKTLEELTDLATAPGGPSQPAPPDAGATDAGTAPDVVEPPPPPEPKKKAIPLDDKGHIKWSPIQRTRAK